MISHIQKYKPLSQQELEDLSERHPNNSPYQNLLASVADNVRIAVERQLNYVDFYTKETDAATNEEKMGLAPLTNSGCES